MNKTVKKIALDKELPEKLPITKNDEIDWLAQSINILIDRLAHKELMLNSELSFKKEYVNKLSHDINTPLTAIRLELFLLQRNGVLDEKSVSSLYQQIEYISKLVNQLNQEDLESAKESYIMYEDIDVKKVVERVIKKWTYIFTNKQIEIHFMSKDKSLIWHTNELWVERILDNVFQNTQLHSRANTLNVIIENGSICIEDNGIGFNVKDSHQGLGLSIIKETCEILNVKYELSSSNNGTRYVFRK